MPRFDLSSYMTVAERIDLFWSTYPQGRIHTEIVHFEDQQIIVKASVWTDRDDPMPVTVDFAEERPDTSPVNRISHVENATTSAIGRALADLGQPFAGTKRPSREEMEKVQRAESRDWIAEAKALTDVDALRLLWTQAKRANVDTSILNEVKEYAQRMEGDSGVRSGNSTGIEGVA